jgi:hypothetical protein
MDRNNRFEPLDSLKAQKKAQPLLMKGLGFFD